MISAHLHRLRSTCAALLGVLLFAHSAHAQGTIHAVPAPQGEPLSSQFKVSAEQADVPVYLARVCALSAEERKRIGAPVENQTTQTSFASFDLEGRARIKVTCPDDVKTVQVLPSTRAVKPTIVGKTFTFSVDKPGALTIEVNGDWTHSLHLFVNPVEKDLPDPKDPKVIYYAPGVHHVQSVAVNAGQTVYVAAGAVVYGDGAGENRVER